MEHLVIYVTIFCFRQFVNNFSALLLWKICIFDIVNVVDVFQIFVISRSTEILFVSNFWLGVSIYVKHPQNHTLNFWAGKYQNYRKNYKVLQIYHPVFSPYKISPNFKFNIFDSETLKL